MLRAFDFKPQKQLLVKTAKFLNFVQETEHVILGKSRGE